MSDLISRTELFNRLARVPIGPYAIDERTQIINVINEMEKKDAVYYCDRLKCDPCYRECELTRDVSHAVVSDKCIIIDGKMEVDK